MKIYSIFGLIFFVWFSSPANAVTLDREGKLDKKPDYYTCTDIKLGPQGAGGKPLFKIQLKGYCGAHPGGGLPGWTPVKWEEVTVYGEYKYDTKVAKENIWVGPDVVFSSTVPCDKNPWAWGPWSSGCGSPSFLSNKTGVVVDGPHPVAAKYVNGSLALAIRKAESAVLTEDQLNDWNPYEQTGGASAVKIITPGQLAYISPATSYTDVALEKVQQGASDPARIMMQIERLEEAPAVVGDIALPADKSHWWQPLHSSDWPYSVFPFPLPVSSGLINGQTGFYRLRVRANAGSQGGYIGGWTPWRTFCIGSSTDCPDELAQQAVGTQMIVTKILTQKIYNQGQNDSSKMLTNSFGGKLMPISKQASSTNASKMQMAPGGFGSKAQKVKPSTAAKIKPQAFGGQAQKVKPSAAAKIKPEMVGKMEPGTQMTTKSGEGPAGFNDSTKPRFLKKTQKKAVVKVNPGLVASTAKLSVKNTYYMPAPLKADQTVNLGIRFQNTGAGDSSANDKYKLTCTVVKGSGDCVVGSGEFSIGKIIPAGSNREVALYGINKTQAGAEYRISIVVPPDQRGRPYSLTLKVPGVKAENIPDTLTPRAIPPVKRAVPATR